MSFGFPSKTTNLSKKTNISNKCVGFFAYVVAWHHVEAVLCDPTSVVSSDRCTVGTSLDLPERLS